MWSAAYDRSASIFLFPRFSASYKHAEFDGRLWSTVGGGEGRIGGGGGVRAMMNVSF